MLHFNLQFTAKRQSKTCLENIRQSEPAMSQRALKSVISIIMIPGKGSSLKVIILYTVFFFTSAYPSFSEEVVLPLLRCFWNGCSLVCSQDPTYLSERQPGEKKMQRSEYNNCQFLFDKEMKCLINKRIITLRSLSCA